jgi:hypothetical protein
MASRIFIKLESQFRTLGSNVVRIKYYLFIEIYTFVIR